MKIKFKSQPYQTDAVDAVVDCFEGQPRQDVLKYTIDPGADRQAKMEVEGFGNAPVKLPEDVLLENIRKVQRGAMLPPSDSLTHHTDDKGKTKPASYKPGAQINLDVEMETGTGKTYVYIKTMFEMHKRYGWSKFIIMVPSVAIREGVAKSIQMTAEHFQQEYGKKVRAFVYNSKRLHELESFSSDAGINVMVINVQAFNASGADNRRIYDELDDFQSRKPIDVIAKNRPILILDEPQKMEGPATQKSLPLFNPLFIMRYSATHRTVHNKVHRLDAVDAFNRKLVKKIKVRGVETKGLSGTNPYLFLHRIETSNAAPIAWVDIEVKMQSGIKRVARKLEQGRNLFDLSKGLEVYKDFVVSNIDARDDTVHFTNGDVLHAGEASGDVTERDIRRIQIRETISAHLEREQVLFARGIKVLSLFFIDEVVKAADEVALARGSEKRIQISFDEWNVWLLDEYEAEGKIEDGWPVAPRLLEDVYTVADAVVVGSLLITLLRRSDRVQSASLAQLVNVIAPIMTEPGGPAWRQTTFHPFATTSRLAQGEVLRPSIEAGTYANERFGDVPLVDAVATYDASAGRASVFLVNRSVSEPMRVEVALEGLGLARVAEVVSIHDEDPFAQNTREQPERVTPRGDVPAELDPASATLSVTLPPLSWTAVALER